MKKTPDLLINFNYNTAADLQHALLSAYQGLKEHDEESYKRVTASLDPFFNYLSQYLDNPDIVKRKMS